MHGAAILGAGVRLREANGGWAASGTNAGRPLATPPA